MGTRDVQVVQVLRLEVPAELLHGRLSAVGVDRPTLSVWSTNETHMFQQLPPLQPDMEADLGECDYH